MKIAILAVVVLILIGGGGYVAASLGLVKVPGISPIDFGKPILASKDESRGWVSSLGAPLQILARDEQADEAAKPKPPPTPVSTTKPPDPNLGDQKVADLWNGLDPAALDKITKKWPEKELAKIFVKMDPDQVTSYLAAIDPERATKISKAIQAIASVSPPSQPTS